MTFLEKFLSDTASRIALFREGEKWVLCLNPEHIFQQNAQGENFWNGEKITENLPDFLEKKMEKSFCVGFFSYDFGKKEKTSSPHFSEKEKFRSHKTGIPNAELVFFREKIECANPYFERENKDFETGKWKSEFPKSHWKKAFDEIQKNIRAGEIYQANLTRLFSANFSGNSRSFFCFLNAHFDAPRSAFFGGKDFEICSMSPETFLDFNEQKMCTKPIKGTAKKGKNETEDERQKENLLSSEKEKAELLMITDLLRNDLSQSAISGSVCVEKLRAVQENESLFHTFSEISAMRKKTISPIRAFLQMLPGGSISGCPKIRATEIIESVEPHQRGIFCGVFGVFDQEKKGESSVLIRTFLRKGEKIYFQAGGGITADSEKKSEFAEINAKTKRFFELTSSDFFLLS